MQLVAHCLTDGLPVVIASRDVRTFPLRVALIEGEALDSWLEFVAYRHHTPPAVLLRYCGIDPQVFLHSWLVRPQLAQFERLAALAEEPLEDLAAATLLRYAGVEFDRAARGQRPRPSAWGWRAFSRLCPQCLSDSGGRWQIAWRLNWTFACLRHRRILAESCACCCGRQRWGTLRAREVPTPGRCARAYRDRTRRAIVACSADLTRAGGLRLADTDPALGAQRLINDLLDGEPVDLPLYRGSDATARLILHDIKTIARWAISAVASEEFECLASAQLVAELARQNRHQCPGATRPSSSAAINPCAAEAAIGIIAATHIVGAIDGSASTEMFARLMRSARAAGRHVSIPAHATLTPRVQHIHARAHDVVVGDSTGPVTIGSS